jgi:hypothetical protein
MDAGVVEALSQAPLLVIVLVFIIYWTDRSTKAQAARDAAHAQDQAARDATQAKELEKRDAAQAERDRLMREFWMQQRVDDRKVMQELVSSVNMLNQKIDAHDEKVDERIAAVVRKPKGSGW